MSDKSIIELPKADETEDCGPYPLNLSFFNTCEKKVEITTYQDIVYLVGSHNFYLLSKQACEFLDDAEKSLKDVVQSNGQDNLMHSLAQAKILDGILSADIQSFIPDKNKHKYDELKDWLDNQHQHARELVKQNPFFSGLGFAAIQKDKQDALNKILDEAISIAKEQEYVYDEGRLYSPREVAIQKELKRYEQARKTYSKDLGTSPQDQIDEHQRRIESLKSYLNSPYHVGKAANLAYEREVSMTSKKLKEFEELTEAIENLALVGIATPEYALAGVTTGDGHSALAQYHQYRLDADKFEQSLQDRLSELSKATDLYAIPPKEILREEYQKLKELRKAARTLFMEAQLAVAEMANPMFLIWSPEDYKPKPTDRVLTAQFPLRECLRAEPKPEAGEGEFGHLRYFSLTQLAHPTKNGEQMNPNLSPRQESDQAYFDAMSQYVTKLPIEENWFDEAGLFQYTAFSNALKKRHIKVESLESGAETWVNAVTQIVYGQALRSRLDPFDSAYQAQLFRFATHEAPKMLGNSVEGKLPLSVVTSTSREKAVLSGEQATETKSTKVVIADFAAKAELVLAKGEINLVQALTGKKYFYIPQKVDPSFVLKDIPYQYKGKTETVDFGFGDLQSRIFIKAYGFAGANLSFGGKLEFDATAGGFAIPKVYSVDQADNDKVTTELVEFKAEASLGMEVGCYVDWHLPVQTSRAPESIEPIPEYLIPDYIVSARTKAITLLKMAVKVEASSELKFPFYLKIVGKKIRFTTVVQANGVKVAFEGDINPDALGAWVWQFQRLLRRCHYRKLEITDAESFQTLSLLSRAILYSQMQVGLFLARGKDTLDNVLEFFDNKRAGTVAHILTFGDTEVLKEWIKYMPPEGLGPLIGTLLNEPEPTRILVGKGRYVNYDKTQTLAMQQIALASICHWLAEVAQKSAKERLIVHRLMEEALARTRPLAESEEGSSQEAKARRLLMFRATRVAIDKYLDKDISDKINSDDPIQTHLNRTRNWYERLEYITNPLFDQIESRQTEYKNILINAHNKRLNQSVPNVII